LNLLDDKIIQGDRYSNRKGLCCYFKKWVALYFCVENDFPEPELSDLKEMAKTGSFPNEPQESVDKRIASYGAVQKVV
jgi:hypothetical protein